MRKIFVALAALALAGCAHQLSLTPADGQGPGGIGSASHGMNGSGNLSVELEGKTYQGRWIYAPMGGSVGFGTAYGGGSVATGTFVGAPGGGGGVAHLTEPGGGALRCQFAFSQWTNKGMGQCQRSSDGRVYDLVIG